MGMGLVTRLVTCSAEDLAIMKAFSGRTRDAADLEGILVRCLGELDLELVRSPLFILGGLNEDASFSERFVRALRRAIDLVGDLDDA